jgi:hypothetical protein
VNAGSGAARVLVCAEEPPFVLVGDCVVAGVVADRLDVFGCVVVPGVWAGAGALSTVTVFVEEPHPPRSPAPSSPVANIRLAIAPRLIAPWYSPHEPLLLDRPTILLPVAAPRTSSDIRSCNRHAGQHTRPEAAS